MKSQLHKERSFCSTQDRNIEFFYHSALGAVLNNQPKFLISNVNKRIPLNRWAKRSEYKEAIKFLANEDNSYMTGQTLVIDGGRTIW